VFEPIDFTRIEAALVSPAGWWELAIVAACFAVGWVIDRRLRLESASEAEVVRLGLGSVNRLLLPLVTLALMLVAAAVFRLWHPPFFLPIAIPLMVALALIRLVVYAMRELFGTPAWLPWSERVVSFTIWGVVLLHFTGVLPELWAELDALEIPIGSRHVSVLELLKGSVVLVVTIAGCLWLSGLVEQRLQKAAKFDSSVRVVISKVVRALLLTVGMLIALQAVGIDLTVLTVFGGALGVGIGLGLQKLASNYIAGFTILLDRSIRLGDRITVDKYTGNVTRLTSRYVIVRSLDGVEAVVPNEILVTTIVLNHSPAKREIRHGLPVQVTHDTDIDLALKLMEAAALAEPRVVKVPPNAPKAIMVRLAEFGIDLELGVWVDDPDSNQLNLRSSIMQAIWKSFRENGIRIPFPLREFRVVAAPDASGDGTFSAQPAAPVT
jgi:small-conductance mechanosensitive channel